MSVRPLEEALTQVVDASVASAPSTMRPQGWRDTAPLPAFAQGEVTRLATGIGAGAVTFSELTRQLITAVQRWVSSPRSALLPHEVFLLGRRLERLRLASHAAQGRAGGFAELSARQALQALPADRTPADVASCARRLAEYVARVGAAVPAKGTTGPGRAVSPGSAAPPATSQARHVGPLLIALVLAFASLGAWMYTQ